MAKMKTSHLVHLRLLALKSRCTQWKRDFV